MDKLSPELLDHIVSYLDVKDTQSLLRVPYRATYMASMSRLSPERHLKRAFRDPASLLAVMTDYGCVLSGSQALEYFVPGSVDVSTPSDWDFLVPCIRSSVIGMMDALAHCGVKWRHPLADLLELLDKPPGAKAYVRASMVMGRGPDDLILNMGQTVVSEEVLALQKQLESHVRKQMRANDISDDEEPLWWLEIEKKSSNSSPYTITDMGKDFEPPADQQLDLIRRPYNAEFGTYGDLVSSRPIHLINGSITVPGSRLIGPSRKVKVQLFQCHKTDHISSTPLEYIMSTFYASHVQCFISGWAAGHFFFDLTRSRLALLWNLEAVGKSRAPQSCIDKYRARGFRFFNAGDIHEEFLDNLATVRHNYESGGGQAPGNTEKPLQPHESAALLQQMANRPKIRCLGMPTSGTFIIRFGALQRRIIAYGASQPAREAKYNIAQYYKLLMSSVRAFCFFRKGADRLKAMEPDMYELRQWVTENAGSQSEGSTFSVSKTLAWGIKQETAQVDSEETSTSTPICLSLKDSPEWIYYERLLRLTGTACSRGTCLAIYWSRPPQI